MASIPQVLSGNAVLGKFELEALLKTGGQGEVWRATADDGAEVAVKVLQVARGIDGEQADRELKRFVREIDTQRTLKHAGIVPVLAHGTTGDRPWYAMPLATGSLRDLFVLNPDGIPEPEVIRLFTLMLDAVVYAHREGVIHRDLKPENVLLFGSDVPRLSDFGLVRRLHSGSSTITIADGLGSTRYAAPEQLEDGHVVDERADIYSLGCILYEMLTGRVFFPHRNLQIAPSKFRGIIHKATELDADRRYTSSVELSSAMKMVAENIERLQSPSSRADMLIVPIGMGKGERSDIAALAQILLQYSDDPQLYLYTLARAEDSAVALLAGQEPAAFKEVVRSFTTLADRVRFDFEYVDQVGRFLCAAIRATGEVESLTLLFSCLIDIAHLHNRYKMRTWWVNAAQEAMKDPMYAPIFVEMIQSRPHCKDFIREGVAAVSLPPIVAEELAA